MAELFDSYDKSYGAVVQSSVDFSGLPHSFFMAAKADLLRDLIATRLDSRHKPAALDVGCGVGAFHPFMRGVFRRHVPPEKWLGFLREIRRVVRPGGLVCVIEHNPFNPLTRLAVARCEFDRDALLLRAGQTQRLMTDAGLRDADTRYFLLLPSATPMMRRIEHGFRWVPLGAQYVTCGIA